MNTSMPTYSDLVTQLADPDADLRRQAIRQLAFWHRRRALGPLQRLLRDQSIAVRMEAIRL